MALRLVDKNEIKTKEESLKVKKEKNLVEKTIGNEHKVTHTYDDNFYEVGDEVVWAKERKNKIYVPTDDVLVNTKLTVSSSRIDKLSPTCIIQILTFQETGDNIYPAYEYKPWTND